MNNRRLQRRFGFFDFRLFRFFVIHVYSPMQWVWHDFFRNEPTPSGTKLLWFLLMKKRDFCRIRWLIYHFGLPLRHEKMSWKSRIWSAKQEIFEVKQDSEEGAKRRKSAKRVSCFRWFRPWSFLCCKKQSPCRIPSCAVENLRSINRTIAQKQIRSFLSWKHPEYRFSAILPDKIGPRYKS